MNKHKPIIFLAFANEKEKESQFLRHLSTEENGISDALKQAKNEGLCDIIVKHSINIDKIFSIFREHQNRIAIFHFGGHANSYQLLLEAADQSQEPAYQDGLMAFLGRQENLELVFLNGCTTEQQVQKLQEYGVPAVIGTTQEIDDKVACTLAIQFYEGLGKGIALNMAWEQAKDNIKTKKGGDIRGLYRKEKQQIASHFPWILKIRAGADIVKKWSLPKAAQDPYFGLPQLKGYGLPAQPYRFLGRYKKEDARIFFGRGQKIQELYFQVIDELSSPVILLSGQSGVGKSSLLEAGLLPRLEGICQVKYIRRTPEIGLLNALKQVLFPTQPTKQSTTNGSKNENEPKDFLAAWKNIEAKKKQPLVIILDQTESVFTNNQQQDLADFLKQIQHIFNQPLQSPQGKLIFSYRSEYHASFWTTFEDYRIPKALVLLEPLEKDNIIEIVKGLTSTDSLKQNYVLSIDAGLARLIADELIADKDSPIAPVLQIILTKLWQGQEMLHQRKFTIDHYQELKKTGILLEDFYEQQIAKVEAWDKANGQDTVQSGLALDVLHFHTTQQAAVTQNLQQLREAYEHRKDILEALLRQFDTAYLLTWIAKDTRSLAHDTLVPVVKEKMKFSEKPGQKAHRILEAKIINFKQDEEAILEPEDLKLVEAGKNGMRVWKLEERLLVTKSQKYLEKIKRDKRRFWLLVIRGSYRIHVKTIS